MEKVSVKLVVFKHPEPARWDTYASYCPATKDFCAHGKSVTEVVDKFKKYADKGLAKQTCLCKYEKLWLGSLCKFGKTAYLCRRIFGFRNGTNI